MLVGGVGLLLHGLSGIATSLYDNHVELKYVSYHMKIIDKDLARVDKIVQGVVTRVSWDDYINHADRERDRQSDFNRSIVARLHSLEMKKLSCK